MIATAGGLGEWLRQAREIAGLSQEELAERAGLTAKGLSAIERGRTARPQRRTMRALADALDLDAEARAVLTELSVGSTLRGELNAGHVPYSSAPEMPPASTALHGRDDEIAAVSRLLTDELGALITLVGPGGVGKTRLAQAIAAAVAEQFPDGIIAVPLAALSDPALVLPAAAHALGLREAGGPLPDLLRRWATGRRALVILDNCEHLLDALPEVVACLGADSGVAILATSRAPLRLRGEREWPVGPLAIAVGDPPVLTDDGALTIPAPAVALFLERARAINPSFALTAENVATVRAICERLDGLPLAIELAAARMRTLAPAALLARLDTALSLLAAGPRDAPAHQRTMRDTIAWSYDLLTPDERRLFRALSTFAGGWDLAAAEAVGIEIAAPLLALGGLVEQSLVVATTAGGDASTRQRLLEPVRQFAAEQLLAADEETRVRAAHAGYFLALAERGGPELFAAEQVAWFERLERDADNFRRALDWFLARDDLDAAGRLGWALYRFWWVRGYLSEGRRWRERVLPRADELPPTARARAVLAGAFLTYADGDHSGCAAMLDSALPLIHGLADPLILARSLGLRGLTAHALGEIERARRELTAGLAVAEAAGDRWGCGMMTMHLGYVAQSAGDLDGADVALARSEAIWREICSTWDLAINLSMRAAVAERQGAYGRIAALARESLRQLLAVRDLWVVPFALEQLAFVCLRSGDATRSARLDGAAAHLRARVGARVQFATDRERYARRVAATREELGEARWARERAVGAAMPLRDAIEEALSIV